MVPYIFPLGILYKVISLTPVINYTKPFARTNYQFASFVPSVVSLAVWNRWTGLLDWNTGLEHWNGLNYCTFDMTAF